MKLNNLDYTWPSGRSGGTYLRTDANGNLSWAAVAGGTGAVNVSTLVFNDIVPVGTIIPWAGASLPADGKWKFCNGEEVLKTAYTELTTVLGDNSPIYGSARTGYIRLPDLEQRVPVGAGGNFNLGNTGGGTSSSISGSTGSTALTINQIPPHRHAGSAANKNGNTNKAFAWGVVDTNTIVSTNSFTSDGTDGDSYGWTGYAGGLSTTNTTAGTTQGHSHSLSGSVSTLQPHLVTRYIIKVLPDDVQQVSITAGNGINVKDVNAVDTDTLDLFSTKIELLADANQFKFNAAGQLQLVTPAVSQTNITSQINNAITGIVMPLTKVFTSTLITIPASANTPVYALHGLGVMPKLVQLKLKKVSAKSTDVSGYDVGTEFTLASISNSGLGTIALYATTSRVGYVNSSNRQSFAKVGGGTFTPGNDNYTNWRMFFVAYA